MAYDVTRYQLSVVAVCRACVGVQFSLPPIKDCVCPCKNREKAM